MSLRIVRATARELDFAVPLFDAYRQFYGQPSDPAGARAFLGERLHLGDSMVFLALDGPDDATTAKANARAKSLYEALGYRQDEIFDHDELMLGRPE